MAIYRLIRESVFEPEAIERMTMAYENVLKVLQLTDREDPITELVARKIMILRGQAKSIPSGFAKELSMPSVRVRRDRRAPMWAENQSWTGMR